MIVLVKVFGPPRFKRNKDVPRTVLLSEEKIHAFLVMVEHFAKDFSDSPKPMIDFVPAKMELKWHPTVSSASCT